MKAPGAAFWQDKKRLLTASLFFCLVLLAAVAGMGLPLQSAEVPASPPGNDALAARTVRLDEPILPIQKPRNLDPRKVALGRLLFHDPRLSHDNSISCASCHDLARGGVDQRPRSIGIGGQEGTINAPTVYNAALNFRQFWDGRSPTLADQVAGPVHNPLEMGSSWPEVLDKLSADRQLVARFEAIYAAPPSAAAIQNAIAEFERSLITPSRFDRWLSGENEAISMKELQGYGVFKRHGCIACHQGANVGGNMFQRFGVMRDYFAGKAHVTTADLGRYNVTGRDEDRYVFKVPSLRNVALTPPYFHDASAATLEDAVSQMGLYQLGIDLPKEDVRLIVLFLRSLTGEHLQ